MSRNWSDVGLRQLGPVHWIKDGHHVRSRRPGGASAARKVGLNSIARRIASSARGRKVKVTLPVVRLLP